MRVLTKEQAQLLNGQELTTDCLFSIILDGEMDRVISEEQAEQCDVEAFQWVKDLPQKEYVPTVDQDVI